MSGNHPTCGSASPHLPSAGKRAILRACSAGTTRSQTHITPRRCPERVSPCVAISWWIADFGPGRTDRPVREGHLQRAHYGCCEWEQRTSPFRGGRRRSVFQATEPEPRCLVESRTARVWGGIRTVAADYIRHAPPSRNGPNHQIPPVPSRILELGMAVANRRHDGAPGKFQVSRE